MSSYRTHHCGALREGEAGKTVALSGWVNSRRDHGGVIFIMLRDQYGLTQVVASKEFDAAAFQTAERLPVETVIKVEGRVAKRAANTVNKALATGEIEVQAKTITVLNTSKTPPFEIDKNSLVKEEALRYRYLHLRRSAVKQKLLKRYAITKAARDFLHEKGFVEIETPLLTKTTPEGARDFLVPSRVFPGEFYALPQSPQQYKQLLMVAGFDRYFQIAKALRDEDSRADRQPEHTQIDLEMCFADEADVVALLEALFTTIVKTVFPEKKLLYSPFRQLSYQESLSKYGSDKPDLRIALEFKTVSALFAETKFRIFQSCLKKGGSLHAFKIEKKGNSARPVLEHLVQLALEAGLAGLVWIAPAQHGTEWKSSAGSALSKEELARVAAALKTKPEENALLLMAGGETQSTLASLGKLRTAVAQYFNLLPKDTLAFAFIRDFPLLTWNAKEKRYDPMHHMFTSPKPDHRSLLETAPEKALSTQYDVVCNGYELCSGSIRIHESALQRKIMRLIGLGEAEIEHKFSHLLEAFDFGAPPHGGAAPGLDRLAMVLMDTTELRDVIAFPKTQRGQDLMMTAPSPASTEQLATLGLKIDYEKLKEERQDYLKKTATFSERTF